MASGKAVTPVGDWEDVPEQGKQPAKESSWWDSVKQFGSDTLEHGKGIVKHELENLQNVANLENFGQGPMANPYQPGSKEYATYDKLQKDRQGLASAAVAPSNAQQKAGKERTGPILDFMVPVPGAEEIGGLSKGVEEARAGRNLIPGIAKRVSKLQNLKEVGQITGAQMAKGAFQTGAVGLVQTGSPIEAAKQAVVGGVMGGALEGTAKIVSPWLQKRALNMYTHLVLKGGGQWVDKMNAKKLVPDLIKRGFTAMTDDGFIHKVDSNVMDWGQEVEMAEDNAIKTMSYRPNGRETITHTLTPESATFTAEDAQTVNRPGWKPGQWDARPAIGGAGAAGAGAGEASGTSGAGGAVGRGRTVPGDAYPMGERNGVATVDSGRSGPPATRNAVVRSGTEQLEATGTTEETGIDRYMAANESTPRIGPPGVEFPRAGIEGGPEQARIGGSEGGPVGFPKRKVGMGTEEPQIGGAPSQTTYNYNRVTTDRVQGTTPPGWLDVRPMLRDIASDTRDQTVVKGKIVYKHDTLHNELVSVLRHVKSRANQHLEISVDEAVQLRRKLDKLADWDKKDPSVTEAMRRAARSGANALRRQLAEHVPGLKEANAEYSFWAGVNDMVKNTEFRKTGHGVGLSRVIIASGAMSSGALLGADAQRRGAHGGITGSAEEAAAALLLIGGLHSMSQSTGAKTMGAVSMDRVGKLLSDGKFTQALAWMGRSTSLAVQDKPAPQPVGDWQDQ